MLDDDDNLEFMDPIGAEENIHFSSDKSNPTPQVETNNNKSTAFPKAEVLNDLQIFLNKLHITPQELINMGGVKRKEYFTKTVSREADLTKNQALYAEAIDLFYNEETLQKAAQSRTSRLSIENPKNKVMAEQRMVTNDVKQNAPRVTISNELNNILVGLKLTPQKLLRMTETERKRKFKLEASLKVHPDKGGSAALYAEATELFNNEKNLQQVVSALTNGPATEQLQKDTVKTIKNVTTQETTNNPKTKGTQQMGTENQESTKKVVDGRAKANAKTKEMMQTAKQTKRDALLEKLNAIEKAYYAKRAKRKNPNDMSPEEKKNSLGESLMKHALSGDAKKTQDFLDTIKDIKGSGVDIIDINHANPETGMTALNGAIHISDPQMVKLLLENGATLNDRAKEDLKVLNDSPAQVAVIEAIENHNKPKEPTMMERMTAAKDAAKAMMFGTKVKQAQVNPPKERPRSNSPVGIEEGISSPNSTPPGSPTQGAKKSAQRG